MKKGKINLKELTVSSFVTGKKELKGGATIISKPIGQKTQGSCGYFICEPSNPYPCPDPSVAGCI